MLAEASAEPQLMQSSIHARERHFNRTYPDFVEDIRCRGQARGIDAPFLHWRWRLVSASLATDDFHAATRANRRHTQPDRFARPFGGAPHPAGGQAYAAA